MAESAITMSEVGMLFGFVALASRDDHGKFSSAVMVLCRLFSLLPEHGYFSAQHMLSRTLRE